jgi:hypothetical protein
MKCVTCSKPSDTSITCSKFEKCPYNLIFTTQTSGTGTSKKSGEVELDKAINCSVLYVYIVRSSTWQH